MKTVSILLLALTLFSPTLLKEHNLSGTFTRCIQKIPGVAIDIAHLLKDLVTLKKTDTFHDFMTVVHSMYDLVMCFKESSQLYSKSSNPDKECVMKQLEKAMHSLNKALNAALNQDWVNCTMQVEKVLIDIQYAVDKC